MKKLNTDVKLLKDLQKGEEKAFEKIFERYSTQLFNVVHKFTTSRSDAEDVVQEVFSKIWKHRIRLNPDLPFTPYIIKIAKNIIINLARKRIYETAYLSYRYHVQSKFNYVTENQVLFKELQLILQEKIVSLPEKRQIVYRMSRNEGLSNLEIAEKLGISERTVENHINHALKEIRLHLSQRNDIG